MTEDQIERAVERKMDALDKRLLVFVTSKDAQAQSPVLITAQLRVNVSESIVPRMRATQLQFGLAGRDVQFIVHDQYFLRRDFEKFCQCRNRLTREVHERLRL